MMLPCAKPSHLYFMVIEKMISIKKLMGTKVVTTTILQVQN